jgi:hypothetical protein
MKIYKTASYNKLSKWNPKDPDADYDNWKDEKAISEWEEEQERKKTQVSGFRKEIVQPDGNGKSYTMTRRGWTGELLEQLKSLGTVDWPDYGSIRFTPTDMDRVVIETSYAPGGDTHWKIIDTYDKPIE